MPDRIGTLGSFEALVLLAVAHGRGEAYGMTVRRALEERLGRTVNIGAVYATLDRMEGKSLVRSEAASVERPGRARRLFRVTAAGARALVAARSEQDAMWADVDMDELHTLADA